MIVENDGHNISDWLDDIGLEGAEPVSQGFVSDFQGYLQRHAEVHDVHTHLSLRHNLVEHIWQNYGHENNEN